MMTNRRSILMASVVFSLLAGCSSSQPATLDEAIEASATLRQAGDGEVAVQPRVGVGAETITLELEAGSWWASVRCLGEDAEVGLIVGSETILDRQECGDGMFGSAFAASAGEPVHLGVDGAPGAYWVLMVTRGDES